MHFKLLFVICILLRWSTQSHAACLKGDKGDKGDTGPAGTGGGLASTQNIRFVDPASSSKHFTQARNGTLELPFVTVGDALASITGSSADNPYEIRVSPCNVVDSTAGGWTWKEGVSFTGSGRDATSIEVKQIVFVANGPTQMTWRDIHIIIAGTNLNAPPVPFTLDHSNPLATTAIMTIENAWIEGPKVDPLWQGWGAAATLTVRNTIIDFGSASLSSIFAFIDGTLLFNDVIFATVGASFQASADAMTVEMSGGQMCVSSSRRVFFGSGATPSALTVVTRGVDWRARVIASGDPSGDPVTWNTDDASLTADIGKISGPVQILRIESAFGLAQTGNYVITNDEFALINASANSITVTLPLSATTVALDDVSYLARPITIVRTDSKPLSTTVTIIPNSNAVGTINGQASITLTHAYASVTVISFGGNVWNIVAAYQFP